MSDQPVKPGVIKPGIVKPDPSLEPIHTEKSLRGPAPFRASFFHDVMIFLRLSFNFWRGFHFMRSTRRAITIFGSARLAQDHEYCKNAYAVANQFAKRGFAVITGGGPSIMQAANHGAYEGGGRSIGINIEIPREQHINPYVTLSMKMRYFFVRKVLLCRYSEAFVIYPGGFGTLDEFFELITLVQTRKMIDRPIILVGREFWAGMLDWIRKTVLPAGMINAAEFDRLRVVDTPEEVVQFLTERLH